MKLYHGSNTDIKEIDFSISKVGKDFGFGFYLTPDLQVAQKQAERRSDIEGGHPVVNAYGFDEAALSNCKVRTFDVYSIEWAEFVKSNRNNRTRQQLHDYDLIIGPIADDDIGMQMRKYNAGRITIDEFMEAIKWKKVSIQYFFGTIESLKYLKKI